MKAPGRSAVGGAADVGVLGVDVGSSGVRTCVCAQDGTLLASADSRGGFGNSGQWLGAPAEQLLDALVASAQGALGSLRRSVEIAGIAVGAFGPAPIPIDRELRGVFPISPYSLDPAPEWARIELVDRRGYSTQATTQDQPLPKVLSWRAASPEDWNRVVTVVDVASYLVAQLTGVVALDAITAYDYFGLEEVGEVPMPEVVDPTAIVGGLSRPLAAALGLPAGTPVAAGTYDSYAELFGAGVREPGDHGILLGSTAVVGSVMGRDEVPAPRREALGLLEVPYFASNVLVGGWTSTSGMALDWAQQVLGGQRDTDLESLARLAPGSGRLIGLPYLSGERAPIWDPNASGALIGLTLDTSPQQLGRAILDGVVLSVTELALASSVLGGSTQGPWTIAGGGTRHQAWLQATADAIGEPIEVVEVPNSASGAACVAWAAQGVEVRVGTVRVCEPEPENTARYRLLLPLYRDARQALTRTMHGLARLQIDADEGMT